MSNSDQIGAGQRHLVIFAKQPRAGAVKTRLAAAIGAARATQIYRQLLDHTLRQTTNDPRWTCWLALSPDRAVFDPAPWQGAVDGVIAQGTGNLGDRMGRVFANMPPGPVVIIGSDLPGLTRTHIAQAFDALGNHDMVIGPADDGGYWLIGHRRRPYRRGLFETVRWSSPTTLSDTLVGAGNQSIAMLEALRDLDTAADLNLLFK